MHRQIPMYGDAHTSKFPLHVDQLVDHQGQVQGTFGQSWLVCLKLTTATTIHKSITSLFLFLFQKKRTTHFLYLPSCMEFHMIFALFIYMHMQARIHACLHTNTHTHTHFMSSFFPNGYLIVYNFIS